MSTVPDVQLLPILAATIAAFVAGGTYYAVLGSQLAAVSPAAAAADARPSPGTLAAELLRCLILAVVVAGLATEAAIDGPIDGVGLGLALWVGFPFVLWTGAILHEATPVKPAVIHAGDWLGKLVLIAVIVSVWN